MKRFVTPLLIGVLLLPVLLHAGGPVHVRGYFRKDGTYVQPHTRKAPSDHSVIPKSRPTFDPSGHDPYGVQRDSHGRIKRSSAARMRFLRSRGLTHTPTGCQVDHVVPLARGGVDDPSNMQLLCGEALKVKERTELR